jgi:transcription antitermination factor NusB
MGKRRKARELAVQVLFHIGFCDGEPEGVFELICESFAPDETTRPFARELTVGVCSRMEELDGLIRQASRNWRLERMSQLDKNVIRLAVFEMLYREDIPPKVSIDEAVEIGKKYGSQESGGFINGVLDKIYNLLLEKGRLERVNSES